MAEELNLFNQLPISEQHLKIAISFMLVATVPLVVLSASAFTRISIFLLFLRQGLGLNQLLPTQILMGLSFLLSFIVMSPTLSEVYEKAVFPLNKNKITLNASLKESEVVWRNFLLSNLSEEDLKSDLILKNSQSAEVKESSIKTSHLISVFIISELKKAFKLGFFIFIPFVVIDLLLAMVVSMLGILNPSPSSIALPIKLFLFVAIDGWSLVTKTLLNGFGA